MRSFLLGVLITLLLIVVGGFVYTRTGSMDLRADRTPGAIEKYFASTALDASMQHQAPRVTSPVPATDAHLIEGMRFYIMNCAGCHGGMDKKPSAFGRSFYPPAPQLIVNPLDDPEWHIFFAVKHGVRWSGMPAWGETVKDDDLWRVTMFLSRVEKLPPAVQKLITR